MKTVVIRDNWTEYLDYSLLKIGPQLVNVWFKSFVKLCELFVTDFLLYL